ncbi:MAG: hypothetical protein DI586_03175 [Micavibrio aeruginosavorus]|uniref:Transglutaminase n=1 Tax=Micavibrio aeruginosavorus TaxID=349221 RepID=A0A2W5FNM7_9BACT|nr:MAG: hypothetical protein DI586_03175 [Micavibrio aeruginosavorus]
MGHKTGTFGKIKAHLERNRLGELLVIRGRLSPLQLKTALSHQHEQKIPLGKILIQYGYVTRNDIASAIATQWAMRALAAVVTVMITASAFNVKDAHAKDAQSAATLAAAPIGSISSYPDLFGSAEKKSSDLSAFTKWGTMFARFDSQMKKPGSAEVLKKWKKDLETLRGLPLETMVHRVNAMANKVPYINDSKNWGKSDYWETPIEFFTRGGDCEDFAITKYASLRALGVPDNRMRIAIVKDTQKGIPHAILIVYTDNGPVVLDNQIKTVTAQTDIAHYKPIFSINRSSWWLHTPNRGTVMASR